MLFVVIVISGCGFSVVYLPGDIEGVAQKDLCNINLRNDAYRSATFDGLELPRSQAFGSLYGNVFLKPGNHTFKGYVSEKVNTGKDEVSLDVSTMRTSSSQSKQRPTSFLHKIINYKNIYKNPQNTEYSFMWYEIEFECKKNIEFPLGDFILGADQLIEKSIQ